MLEGNNTIELNVATVMKALQYWFDNILFKEDMSPQIIGITTTNISSSYSFIIKVEKNQKEKVKAAGV